MREIIISKIQEMATNGAAPGQSAFMRATGIKKSNWCGVYWARWGDAVIEAGFVPNKINQKFNDDGMLTPLIDACRHFGRVPSAMDLRIYRRTNKMPNHSTYIAHFGSVANAYLRLREWTHKRDDCNDIVLMLNGVLTGHTKKTTAKGFVYLIKSGGFYKIGRSDNVERRIKEIRVSLPEEAAIVHIISTDDASGIEAYWHNRFGDRRANGEWFKLTSDDVASFKRRKTQ